MELALDLARRGGSAVSPNPKVGCILVKNGDIIGQGYHQEYGGPHAEVMALRDAVTDPIDATAYVTLEPCSFYGKTPPCTNALVESGIREVFVAMTDPNPGIDGEGLSILRARGVRVTTGILAEKAAELNKGYIKWIVEGKPWVIAKAAVSADDYMGYNATSQTWLTGEESRIKVHRLRSEVNAVLIGRQTALVDDPRLTVRETVGENPVRVVADTHCRLPLTLNLFRDQQAETIVLCSEMDQQGTLTSYCRYVPVRELNGQLDPEQMLKALGKLDITTLLIEGGRHILASFFADDLIDEIYLFRSEQHLGKAELGNPLHLSENWVVKTKIRSGADELTIAQKRKLKCLQE
ncbi:MAG: bifunctional diaminohydroxyphosphoribosylaminopyrimidine deaminase/5-amino-6-(5-phosphoribosylamino)uracil reductase RibD [FCB group bacterium]|nr:bifunctional diaminohydroxyphosphoribosylaminopyrimidine deaminase/5-amino-6-(5-phosphoribosylamino)uracil reductase RibD [FCB group bacterium]